MTHRFSMLGPDVLCVKYADTVAYAERQVALPGAARMLNDGALHNLLVDFSDADLVEEDAGARRDFIAAAIAAPWPGKVRIASVGLPSGFSKPVELASVVRELDMRAFQTIDEALSWLRGTPSG